MSSDGLVLVASTLKSCLVSLTALILTGSRVILIYFPIIVSTYQNLKSPFCWAVSFLVRNFVVVAVVVLRQRFSV